MKILIFILLLYSLPAFSLSIKLEDCIVDGTEDDAKRVVIRVLKEKVEKQEKLKMGSNGLDNLSYSDVDELVRSISSKGGYDLVEAFEVGGLIKFRLNRTDRTSEVRFNGFKALSEGEARSIFGVDSETVISEKTLEEGVQHLKQIYKERGYFQPLIELEVVQEKGKVLIVKVSEGSATKIKKVLFTGANKDLNNLLKDKLDLEDDVYTGLNISRIQTQLRVLLNKYGYFRAALSSPEVEPGDEDNSIFVKFNIENPFHYEFDFNGNREITSATLEKKAMNLSEFYSANPSLGLELAARMKAYYLREGFARVEINSEEKSDNNRKFLVKIFFTIDEGPKIKISKFGLTGHFSQAPDFYAEFIKGHSTELISDGYYNKEDVELGLENLINELRNRGFLLAKLASAIKIQYNKERNQVTVYVNLEEGPLTQIQEVVFTGNHFFSREQLLKEIEMPDSGPLRLMVLENSVEKIKKLYLENGFIEMVLLNEKDDLIGYDETNTKARVNFKINEGPQVRVGSILLEGNTFSQDKLILLELEMKVGDIVTPTKIDESIARVQRTGYFSSIEIRTLEKNNPVANRTLVVRVRERDPGLFKMGIGVTNERDLTLRGYTGIAYRNLFGTGRGVSLRVDGKYNVADIKYLENKITLGYVEPYLLETRIRGRINLTREKTVSDYVLRKVTELNNITYSLEKDFTSHITGIWDVWGLATYKDFGIDPNRPVIESKVDIASTDLTLNLDFRDSPFVPTKGTFTTLTAEYGGPSIGGEPWIEYNKFVASWTGYIPFYHSKVVWANQLKLGELTNLDHDVGSGVPYDKKGFVLGGRATVRGFEAGTDEVFPNRFQLDPNQQGISEYLLKTKAQMGLIKSEVRFPIYGSFGGSLFYDGGFVVIEGLKFDDSYRDAAGFGLNLATPVGPVNFEFAWKLDQKPGESPWRFHLSMGSF